MGEDHSTTSLHKDHYENLYAVVAGEKHFILYPPTDVHFLYERPYESAQYVKAEDGKLQLQVKKDSLFKEEEEKNETAAGPRR